MRHHHEQSVADLAKCLPALLPVLNAIFDRHEERIPKHFGSILKADAVLPLVGEVFGLVPFKTDSTHYNIIITYMALCNIPLLLNQTFPFLRGERREFDIHPI